MNRKGFTFIELLAVIVVLGLTLVLTMPSMSDTFKNSKIKSEEAFVKRLSQAIDSYVTLNTDKIAFNSKSEGCKNGETVDIYHATITAQNIIDDGIITAEDYKDPNTNKKCDTDKTIDVYRDSDYVYCHTITKSILDSCLSDEYKEKNSNEIILNTCPWEDNKCQK